MSWLQSVSSSGEDVFDENADELNLQSREWSANMKRRVRDGYVDGIDAGEDGALQSGFNLGFREGAAQTVLVGRLKGIVTAIWCWCQGQHPENPAKQMVYDLLRQVTQHEESLLEDMKRTLENPPPSVSDVAEAMEDLSAEPAGGGCCGERCDNKDCCKGGDKMQTDFSLKPHAVSDSSHSDNKLSVLLQRCAQIATEMALPSELTAHIESLRKM
ncbi:unnamed protein product [Knipowitschia caucasica]